MTELYWFLDAVFFIFHGLVVLVNVFGWIPRRTRRLHLVVMVVTAISWFALGPLFGYGVGYCFCTDWHWRVRRALGYDDVGNYVQLLLSAVGLQLSAEASSMLAYGAFAAAAVGATLTAVFRRRITRSGASIYPNGQ
jgi:hypothetical protein